MVESKAGITRAPLLESMPMLPRDTSPSKPWIKLLESIPMLPQDTSPSERSVKVSLHYALGLHSTQQA